MSCDSVPSGIGLWDPNSKKGLPEKLQQKLLLAMFPVYSPRSISYQAKMRDVVKLHPLHKTMKRFDDCIDLRADCLDLGEYSAAT
jgi:hypothetical protein